MYCIYVYNTYVYDRYCNWLQDPSIIDINIKILNEDFLHFDDNGLYSLKFPILIKEHQEQIGIKVNAKFYTNEKYKFIEENIHARREVEIIDVLSQTPMQIKFVDFWKHYQKHCNENIKEIWNCLSLEYSEELLSNHFTEPTIINTVDWSDICSNYPVVRKFFIVSWARSYTDWHIDFSGTGVYYHVICGEKWFYLIPPSTLIFKYYFEWNCLQLNGRMWFPEYCRRRLNQDNIKNFEFTIFRLVVHAKETVLLPSGWMHCVYTPYVAQALGGNYLSEINAKYQIQCFVMEELLAVGVKYKLENFFDFNAQFIMKCSKTS